MKKIIPVIHLVETDQMLQNIETCLAVGIQQVFLINHQSNYVDLLKQAMLAQNKYPELWIGLNALDLSPSQALKLDLPFAGLWMDIFLTPSELEQKKYTGEIFSGLNFKYQKQFYGEELMEAVKTIKETSTVACTSGEGTGKAAALHKIEQLKGLLGDFPLALASGITAANIQSYIPYIDYFLVASSITDKNEIINQDLLKELIAKI